MGLNEKVQFIEANEQNFFPKLKCITIKKIGT